MCCRLYHNGMPWPPLALDDWRETRDTLQMWTQIVGKICLALTPRVNHFWNVALHITSRGLMTPPLSYRGRTFTMTFDFLEHALVIDTSDGAHESVPLRPETVADFYQRLMGTLHSLGIDVRIWTMPVEVPEPIRFDQDTVHRSYRPGGGAQVLGNPARDKAGVRIVPLRFHRQVQPAALLLGQFRSGGHAVFRAAGAGASWRRRNHARSVFA